MGGNYRQRGIWRACFLARAVRPAARDFSLQHWKPIRIDLLLTFSSRDHGPGGGGGGRGGRGGGGLGLGGWTVLKADLRTGGRSTRYSSNSLQLVQPGFN